MARPSLIALDWGTSSLRAWLIDEQGEILQQRSSEAGVLAVAPGGFPAVFNEIAGAWFTEHGTMAALACGMVGSRQGWVEAPYAPCPCAAEDLQARLVDVDAGPTRLAIVPGVVWDPGNRPPDVMRGEETQVFGALAGAASGMFVLPGTHSKWARVEAGKILRFTTYMTGEVFAVLRQHSILGRTMSPDETHDPSAFADGVRAGLPGTDLLHRLFEVRTLALFDRLAPAAAGSFLSGLLIGSEIAAARSDADTSVASVTLIGAAGLAARYREALDLAGIAAETAPENVTARGLWRIAVSAGMIAT